MSRVTWFTGRARTWFIHLQPSDSPVNKLSVSSEIKFGGFRSADSLYLVIRI